MLPGYGALNKTSLLDSLRAKNELNAKMVEHVDLLNNFLEQRRSIELLQDVNCEMVEKHPEWKDRVKSQLDLLLTDAIIDFRKDFLYSKLAVLLDQMQQIIGDKQSSSCSLTFADDSRAVCTELKSIFDYYERRLEDCRPPDQLETKSTHVDKKTKKAQIDLKKIGESYFVFKALQRLEYDLSMSMIFE